MEIRLPRFDLTLVEWLIILVIVGILAAISIGIIDGIKQRRACEARGGTWAVVGQHEESHVIFVGKVPIVQHSTVNDYACIERRTRKR